MDKLINFLKNKKTYGVATIIILIVIAENLLGWDIPSIDTTTDPLGWILGALGLSTTRAAISKATKK